MGEGQDIPPDMARYTVRDAADMLGITTGAVRNRLSRGTLQSIKERGTVYVLLPERDTADTPRDTERDAGDTPDDMPSETSALVAQLRDENSYLREQLDAERQARTEERRRADTVIAQLTSRIPQLEAPQKPQDTPSEAEPRSDRGTPPQEPESPADRRPFWRKIFGQRS